MILSNDVRIDGKTFRKVLKSCSLASALNCRVCSIGCCIHADKLEVFLTIRKIMDVSNNENFFHDISRLITYLGSTKERSPTCESCSIPN